MMISKQLEDLLTNFMAVVENVEAVLVTDLDGLILSSHLSPGMDEDVLGALSAIVQPILEKIKQEFAVKNFGTASFDTEEYRLLFLEVGHETVLSIVLSNVASIDQTMPVAFLLAEKVARVVGGQENVQVDLPRMSLYIDNETEQNRIKNQVYQLRLKEGKYRFKFVVIGDATVGKTSLIMQFVEKKFAEDYRATIGLNVLVHSYTLLSNTDVIFQIWDIGAHDYFRRVRSSYYTGAHAAFILYDITNRTSFEHIQKWYDEIMEYVGTCPVCLVGNKRDLEGDRQVEATEALQVAEKIEASFLETSAKTGQNVEDAFTLMAYRLVQAEQDHEEEILKTDIQEDFQSRFDGGLVPSFGILNEHKLWNPLLDLFLHMPVLGDVQEESPAPGVRILQFSTGVKITSLSMEELNETLDMNFFQGMQGVICLFSGQGGVNRIPALRSTIANLIAATKPACAILVGIQCDEEEMNHLVEAIDLNPLLEENPSHGVLFFNIAGEYNIGLLDNIKILLNSLPEN